MCDVGGLGLRRVERSPAVTVYSVATGIQYINTADDRARGKINNPLDSAANRLAPEELRRPNGPFAGDVAVYALRLYSDSALKTCGTAVYTCFFNYDRHALCQAYYKFKAGGTIVGSGPVDFKRSSFTIVVTRRHEEVSRRPGRGRPPPPRATRRESTSS